MKTCAIFVSAIAAIGLGCQSPESEETATAVQAACTTCIDPEAPNSGQGPYVSIGVMPARYRIDWSTPNKMFLTTVAASLGFGQDSQRNNHSIGHVLLKVHCGEVGDFYLSQTGALRSSRWQYLDLLTLRANMIFKTFGDGKLYLKPAAEADWNAAVERQMALANGTYPSDPTEVQGGLLRGIDPLGLVAKIRALPALNRHHFVRATIRITEAQCNAIFVWKHAYETSGAPARYSAVRAPWIRDADGKYDGGACGSVSFAGAFYMTGLDYQKAAARTTQRRQLGTARLTTPITRDIRRMNGWYLLQREAYYTPDAVNCKKVNGQCIASEKQWLHPLYDAWNETQNADANLNDAVGIHNLGWPALGGVLGGLGMPVESTTIPLIVFEPEKFYEEILARWNNANYDAFGHPGWCKIDSKVPTIVLDGRRNTTRQGIRNGFAGENANLQLSPQ